MSLGRFDLNGLCRRVAMRLHVTAAGKIARCQCQSTCLTRGRHIITAFKAHHDRITDSFPQEARE